MISTETRKFILRIIIVCVYYSTYVNGCDSNKLYTEIGCNPIYNNDSNSCPLAYNCENVFTRPANKCYFNGNVYEPSARLSDSDSALSPCLASCFCDQRSHNNITISKITCAHVECPSYFMRVAEPCYYQYDKDLCCEVKTYCPEEKTIVHECTYEGTTYKKGQRIYINDDVQCICSEEFNGTFSNQLCRKTGCSSEINHMENVLKRNAPIYYKKADGCPIEWYHAGYDTAVGDKIFTSKSDSHVCKYGDLSFSVGQNVIIGSEQSDSDTYKTTCSCTVPPLLTCIKTIQSNIPGV